MSMIMVDPELFVTCRLCLEDKGSYQIVPTVIQQIKYCFDINVDSFDGLPQLLCKKCETVLSEYFKTKKSFLDKQNYLINRLQGKNDSPLVSQHEAVSSSQHTEYENNENEMKIFKAKKRKANISSTSSDAASVKAQKLTNNEGDITNAVEKLPISWQTGYKKQFLCRMCKVQRTKKSAVLRHARVHEHLKIKYHKAFKKFCTVKLNKIDDAPNITGTKNAVVYSQNKIIQGGNSNYFVVYSKQATDISDSVSISDDSEVHNSKRDIQKLNKKCPRSDSSDQDIIVNRKRRRRLVSRSSNETVVIGTNNKCESSDSEEEIQVKSKRTELSKSDCINIEDSSDGISDENNIYLRSKNKKQLLKADNKTINNIVSMCRKNYIKKMNYDNTNKNKHLATIEPQLNHKILSIGLKKIYKQGFNCLGLLRFMEHKNLDVVWLVNDTQKMNYIKIMTQLKDRKNNDSGWKNLSNKLTNVDRYLLNSKAEHVRSLKATKNQINRPTDNTYIDYSSAVLYDITCHNDTKNKLLNANPVANPKQLPRKSIVNDTKNISVKTMTTTQNVSNDNIDKCGPNNKSVENPDIDLSMPIITSTQSLAMAFSRDRNDIPSVNNDAKTVTKSPASQSISDISTPRIKVKPASELMSDRVLNFNNLLNQPNSVLNNIYEGQQIPITFEVTSNVCIPNSEGTQLQKTFRPADVVEISSLINIPSINMPSESSVNNVDYVILDTAELPNTKTDSPFKYLKSLLQIHKITLLDINETLSPNFTCLIKFKVLFKQETKDQPVILCLSLFCLEDTFCLNIKDRNQDNINMTKISANWQWEILKIYKGDVVKKLLQNAQRVSQKVYEKTNNFLCLLKSIEYKKST